MTPPTGRSNTSKPATAATPVSKTASTPPARTPASAGSRPGSSPAINQAWLQLALTGIDLLAWTQLLLLHGDLATAEPKKLRYRLLHVVARTARTTRLRIAEQWPWAFDLATAFRRLAALPRPAG
jgi:hypothetical protein